MITTLTGENSFDLQRNLRELTEAFIGEHGDLAVERVDGEEAAAEQLQEALTALPFLANKKLVIARSLSSNKQFAEGAERLLGDVPETNDVILVEPKLDKRTAYYKLLKKTTDFREFPVHDPQGMTQWLVAEATSKKGSISSADARYLVELVGADQQLLSNELEKLLLYSSKIDRRTIDLLTEPTPQSTIFQLLEATFAGNKKRAAQLYSEQRIMKVEPVQIIAMLTWQLHVLAIIKAAGDRSVDQIAKDAKLNPFVVRKSQAIARKLTTERLKELVHELLEIDVAAKSTSINADDALQHYLLKLSV